VVTSSDVRAEQVTEIYRQDSIAVEALKGADLEIAEGEFLALIGPHTRVQA